MTIVQMSMYLELGHGINTGRPKKGWSHVRSTGTHLGSKIGRDTNYGRAAACKTHGRFRRCRIRSSLGRPGLGDAARFQHRFGVLAGISHQSALRIRIQIGSNSLTDAVRETARAKREARWGASPGDTGRTHVRCMSCLDPWPRHGFCLHCRRSNHGPPNRSPPGPRHGGGGGSARARPPAGSVLGHCAENAVSTSSAVSGSNTRHAGLHRCTREGFCGL